ncbi:hypothetical protein INT48_004080 [Thamnidium elegans]|uniref:Ubiquitin-like protease family profile domain-containing protein n=1 Tax=Thamnidium elegans TaxID=101142 RepID=A0A8H7SFU7_9FUNG|nr:hypothetical protein INT48_004080 [Thamnidium elegans]
MRNNNSRPHESSSNKFQRSIERENYAAARNKKLSKGSPIPIPQGPNHDSSNLKIISRMKRKDGPSQKDTVRTQAVRTQTKYIPTRSSNRLQPRKKKEEEVIEIQSDEEEQTPRPLHRKRRIVQRDNSSDEETEKKTDFHRMREVTARLRRGMTGRETQEKIKDREQVTERNERDRESNRKTQEKRKCDEGRLTSERADKIPKVNVTNFKSNILPNGPKKDYSKVQAAIEKMQSNAIAILPSSSKYLGEARKESVIASEPERSYIDKQKDTARAGLIQRLNISNSHHSSKTLPTPRIPIYTPRDPFKESQKAYSRPTLTESVHKTSSIYHLPDSLAPELDVFIKKPAKIEAKKVIEKETPVKDIFRTPVEEDDFKKPVEEEKPKLPYDPIDDEPIKPIGVDKHLLTYPFEGKKSVTIYERDLERLEEDQFLNDSLLDIFPKIWADQYPNSSTHTYSSFFYTKLAGDGSSVNYDKIGRWTANINIFEKKLIIIPIAQHHHWYLVVVTNPGLCINNRADYGLKIDHIEEKDEDMDESDVSELKVPSRPGRKAKNLKAGAILDHALGGSKFETCRNTSEYLKKEAMQKLNIKEEDFVEPEFVYTDCPNQKNFVDCGVFCLHYMKSLYQYTERMMDNNLKGDKGWDIENTLPNFRLVLKRILKKNMVQYREYLRKAIEQEE